MKLNQHGSAMIFVLSLAFILNVSLLAFFFNTRHNNKVTSHRKLDITALNIAEGGKEHFYSQVINNICLPLRDSSATWFSNEPFKQGYYTVSYRANSWADTLWIVSKGVENSIESIIDVTVKVDPYLRINNPPVLGAVTARSRVEVSGSITIDGRDHDTLCNKTGSGVYGISSFDSVKVGGSAKIGGNNIEPVKRTNFEPVRETVVDEKVPAAGAFTTPEAFLGLPAGSLNSFKSNDPNIPQNFRALIYKTCDVGPIHFGDDAAGVLIVHNSTSTAKLTMNSGTFKGIIIADNFDKIAGNITIHGAVVAIKDTMIIVDGVGNATICYSSQILKHLSTYCTNFRKSVNEVSWKERVQ